EKAADTTPPTTNSTPSTTAATPQTTADQNLATETPRTRLDQNTVIQKVTESVKETPVLSFLGGLSLGTSTEGSLAVSNVKEYYTGSQVYSMTVKAQGGLTFAQNLDPNSFVMQKGFSQLTIQDITRVSDTEVTLKVSGSIINGAQTENGQYVSYDNGTLLVKNNQLSGTAGDKTVTVPVSTPKAVLQNVKADGEAKPVDNTGNTVNNIFGDTKKISETIVFENAEKADYWFCVLNGKGKDDCGNLELGGAFAGAVNQEVTVNQDKKNEMNFSFDIPKDMMNTTGTVKLKAENNRFNQNYDFTFNINSLSLANTITYKENSKNKNILDYTAVFTLTGGNFAQEITAKDITFNDDFFATVTSVQTDKAKNTVTVHFQKGKELENASMYGQFTINSKGYRINYNTDSKTLVPRGFGGTLSCELIDPYGSHLKYEEDPKSSDSEWQWSGLKDGSSRFNTFKKGATALANGLADILKEFLKGGGNNALLNAANATLVGAGVKAAVAILDSIFNFSQTKAGPPALTNEKLLEKVNDSINESTLFIKEQFDKQNCYNNLVQLSSKSTVFTDTFYTRIADAANVSPTFKEYCQLVSDSETSAKNYYSSDIKTETKLKEMNTAYRKLFTSDATLAMDKVYAANSVEEMRNIIPSVAAANSNVQNYDLLVQYDQVRRILLPANQYESSDKKDVLTSDVGIENVDVFTSYKNYMSVACNYNSQTWVKRARFNQEIHDYYKYLNSIFVSAIQYDNMNLYSADALLTEVINQDDRYLNDPQHQLNETQRNNLIKERSDSIGLRSVVESSIRENTGYLNKLNAFGNAFDTAYNKATADLETEKAQNYIECYRGKNQYYRVSIKGVNDYFNSGVRNSQDVKSYLNDVKEMRGGYLSGKSNDIVPYIKNQDDSNSNKFWKFPSQTSAVLDSEYLAGYKKADFQALSNDEYNQLHSYAKIQGKTAWADLQEAALAYVGKDKSSDEIKDIQDHVIGVLAGTQSSNWDYWKNATASGGKEKEYDTVKLTVKGKFVTKTSPDNVTEIMTLDARWRNEDHILNTDAAHVKDGVISFTTSDKGKDNYLNFENFCNDTAKYNDQTMIVFQAN
ncbi:MAG: hypothetical protein PHN26_08980, partial [Eubacteriaceae bacterium]|nr:hypothetical protein [Eubacteriaceae bacterium]